MGNASPMSLSKSKIVRQFNRAASRYDRFAQLQGDVSADLVKVVDAYAGPEKDTLEIADFGCGTGTLIKSLADLGYQHLFGFDIAPMMLEEAKQKCPPNVSFACGDIESLAIADNSFDVIVSNAAIQWCQSGKAFSEISRTLRTGGRAFVCTFGPDTLQQWQETFSIDGQRRVHTFETPDQITNSINGAGGLTPLSIETQLIDVAFTSVSAMLDSVRRVGASNAQQNSGGKHISRSDYQAVKARFQETLQTKGKLTLTYEVISIVAEKK